MPRRGDDFSRGYTPAYGDLVHLNWNPALGSEMINPHYGLVLSQTNFNIATGLAVITPITSKVGKVSGFELEIISKNVNGVAILSQFRTFDYQVRSVQYEATISESLIAEAVRRVKLIF